MSAPTTYDAACELALRGWYVLPCAPREKVPASELVPNGQDDASTNLPTLRHWFARRPDLNLAIACGPSQLVVIDADPPRAKNGNTDGVARLRELEVEHGPLPRTPTQDTGGGGEQYLFRAPGGVNFVGKLGRAIDIKRNGYVVVPPSIHPDTGNAYQWRAGLAVGDVEIAELPAAWVELLRVPEREERTATGTTATGESIYDALASLDQRYVLECLSGTSIVDGERFQFRRARNGKWNLLVNRSDGWEGTSNFVDAAGKIGAHASGTKEDGGPLASTWLRWYRHDDKAIRAALVEHVPELGRWERERIEKRKAHTQEPRDESPHSLGASTSVMPEPLRRKLPPQAPYPVDALGVLLGSAARALHEHVQAPLALCGQSILAAASLAAQPHADVTVDGRRYPITLWAITVAESGERKSAADRLALAPHAHHEHERIMQAEKAIADKAAEAAAYNIALERAKKTKGTVAEIAEAIRQCGPAPVLPPSGVLMAREPTVEALQKVYLTGVPSLGLFSDEGASFFGGYSMGKDHAMNAVGQLCKLWDDGTSDRMRATDGQRKLYGRRLAMHLLMQPVIAEKVLSDPLLAGQGFLARCLVAWPETTAGTRAYRETNPRGDTRLVAYRHRMAELLELVPVCHSERAGELEPRELGLSRAAKDEWVAAYNAIEKHLAPTGSYAQVRPWASKAAEQILRIAAVITITGDSYAAVIDTDAIRAAAKLVAWHLGEAVRVFDTATIPPAYAKAEKVLAWCHAKGIALVDARTLQNRGPNGVRSAAEITEAMDVLVRHGWAELKTNCFIGDKTVRRAWAITPESRESQESP